MASVSKRKWTHKGVKKEAWIARWVDRTGAHRQKTFGRRKDADNHVLKLDIERAEQGHIGHIEARTVKELSREFVRGVERRFDEGRLKRGTLKNLSNSHRIAIVPRFGGMKADDIKPVDVVDFYEWLRTERRLSPNTARARVGDLGALLEFGMTRGVVRKNPVKLALAEIGGEVKVKIRTFETAEVRHLLEVAHVRAKGQHRQTWKMTETVCHIAAFCGLRIGEIMALSLSDIDFEASAIHVRHSLSSWDELTDPKTPSSLRTVPLPPHVASMLRDWIAEYYIPNNRLLVFRSSLSRGGPIGKAINPASFFTSYWRPLLLRAGLWKPGEESYHFHALRHFCGSWWLNNAVPITDTSRLLGHASPTITMSIYAHALLTDRERCAAVVQSAAALLSPPAPLAIAHELRNDEKTLLIQ